HALHQEVLELHVQGDRGGRRRNAVPAAEHPLPPGEGIEDDLRDLHLEERGQLRLAEHVVREQGVADPPRLLRPRQHLLQDVGLDLAHPHQDRTQAEVVPGRRRVHGPPFAEEELGLLLGPLEREDARAVAHVQEREQVGHLDLGEIALQDLLHDGCPMLYCLPARRTGTVDAKLACPGAPPRSPGGTMTTFKDLIRRVKSEVQEVSPEEARDMAGRGAVIVDVRENDEWVQGHIPGALFIPRGFLELRIEEKVPDKSREIVLQCAGGTRSALAAKTLQELGYARVSSMAGGFGKWKEAGLPIEVPRTLSAEQKSRYSRHLLVPEVGEAGQAKLLASKVLLVGAGGLGSPSGLYLAAAGVGTIGLVDSDVV